MKVCPYLGFRPPEISGWEGWFAVANRGFRAGVAQLVEHLICNQRVGGSNPFASSTQRKLRRSENNGKRVLPASVSCAPGLSSAVIPMRCMLRNTGELRVTRKRPGGE